MRELVWDRTAVAKTPASEAAPLGDSDHVGRLARAFVFPFVTQPPPSPTQAPAPVLWFTGLSGAGKSTVATQVETALKQAGRRTCLLDGDAIRRSLCSDLGFSDADRSENVRRVAEVARLLSDAGVTVLVALISPRQQQREAARQRMAPGTFCEIFVDAPLAVTQQRDPKGLYARALRGELKEFTGIDSVYEPPTKPELRLDTTMLSPQQACDLVLQLPVLATENLQAPNFWREHHAR